MKRTYLGISRPVMARIMSSSKNHFNPSETPYVSLGDTIAKALQYGADVGSPAVVKYDPDDTSDVDILTSPDHDFHDIAETMATETSEGLFGPPLPAKEDNPSE